MNTYQTPEDSLGQSTEQPFTIDSGGLSNKQRFDAIQYDFFTDPVHYLRPAIEPLLVTINSNPLLVANGQSSYSTDDIINTFMAPQQVVFSRSDTFTGGLTTVQSMRQNIRGGGIPQYVKSENLTQLNKSVFPEEIYYYGLDIGIGAKQEDGTTTYMVDDSNLVIVGVFGNDRNTKRYLDLISTIKMLLLNQAQSTAPDSEVKA